MRIFVIFVYLKTFTASTTENIRARDRNLSYYQATRGKLEGGRHETAVRTIAYTAV